MSTLSPAEYRWSEHFDALYWQGSDGHVYRLTAQEIEDMSKDVYQSYFGKSFDRVIIDDPVNDQPKKGSYNTVGVRFLRGSNLAKLYTYRVKKGSKLHLGQEVVVPTDPDRQGYDTNTIAVVVRIDAKPTDNGPYNYKFIAGTVKPL